MRRLPAPEKQMKVELSEAEFQKQVTDLADLRGWQWMHIQRMGDPMGHWRTPVTGPLGKGWPDLVLVRGNHLIFAELKRQGKLLTVDQQQVQLMMYEAAPYYVWRPSDWAEIVSVLA